MPLQLRETLAPSVAPEAAAAMAHPPDEQFVDPTDWETDFFSELIPQKIFSTPLRHSSPCTQRHKSTVLKPSERPSVTSPLVEKRGALGNLFLPPQAHPP